MPPDYSPTDDKSPRFRQSSSQSPEGSTIEIVPEKSRITSSTHEARSDTTTTGRRDELAHIAAYLDRTSSSASGSGQDEEDLSKRGPPEGAKVREPYLDPTSSQFDFGRWARTYLKYAREGGFVLRRTGLAFRNLTVSGSSAAIARQDNVISVLLAPFQFRRQLRKDPKKTILSDFSGLLGSGELLLVLGRPGSGCSTLLKTLTGERHGLLIDDQSVLHYNGIPYQTMSEQFKGDIVYNQEVDKHFPHLTVRQTLEFAAKMRTPHKRILNVSRAVWTKYMAQVVMAVFGLLPAQNTKVGSDFVRGVSGGERKRVSIAEMALAGSPVAAWDNATRGLDAATALDFVQSLRLQADLRGTVHAVAIYQASQAIYDEFDKVVLLYEGRLVYFGSTSAAREYFEGLGWYHPPRQTTGDFLTSLTNPRERRPREGYETRVPRSPEDFERCWRRSGLYEQLQGDLDQHQTEYPTSDATIQQFMKSRRDIQAKHLRRTSPYLVSIPMQVRYCTIRAYQRLWNDKVTTVTAVVGQTIMALIVGSIYFGTVPNTNSFFSKAAVLFFSLLLNALNAVTEINNLYAQRPMVEKHASYAFHHPFTEALAGVVSEFPVKLLTAVLFNIIIYFLAGLRPEPGPFFIFFLFIFVTMIAMSMIFKTLAAATRTVSQALTMAGLGVIAMVIYAGFTIPRPYMHPWFKWISWINPLAYAFEALLVNEVHGRVFPCAALVPPYPGLDGPTFVCPVPGAQAGQRSVSGDAWVEASYQYSYSHLWRNLGILFAFLVVFLLLYLLATELNSATGSSAEVLVFRRGHVPKKVLDQVEHVAKQDVEAPKASVARLAQTSSIQDDEIRECDSFPVDAFAWRHVSYGVSTMDGPRQLLDDVSGWVKPGTMTALMGVSGAGKTTLLDVLATRTSVGVVTGEMLMSGRPLGPAFQRSTGYVQQQDLHLETTTVREALQFSAMLRQPKSTPEKAKYASVESVISMLEMEEYAEAIVGVPGEGLNVLQRKLLTIGVELAAKPAMLLFLDEPTSGLDSQSSWAIVAILRKLANHGQAILATIHQPSAVLFQEFDRLLFLAKGGKTVYFGEIGERSERLAAYFSKYASRTCDQHENPAEYVLSMVGGKQNRDWHAIWRDSVEAKGVQDELDRIQRELESKQVREHAPTTSEDEFAMPLRDQVWYTSVRVLQQYWRSPTYVWSKLVLGVSSALFIGFSFFQSDDSLQGLQNVLFSIFLLAAIFTPLVQQIMPRFVKQRSLYEVRERPSKAYSWVAFILANVAVEIPYQIFMGIIIFASYYYPIFGIQSGARQGLILLFCVQFFVFASTFAHALIAALPNSETAAKIATTLFSLCLTFSGVIQPPDALPGFWIFMYRVSPLTYLISGIASTGLHGRAVRCSGAELAVFQPADDQTCGSYLAPFLAASGGALYNPSATVNCQYCPLSNADQFLQSVRISYGERWRNYGLGFAYIAFNIAAAVGFYYLFRVRSQSMKGPRSRPKLPRFLHTRGAKD